MEPQAEYKTANTTLAISRKTSQDLDKYCVNKSFNKKEFVEISLRYFKKFGIDPSINETPIAEVKKIEKRIEDLVTMFRAQERDVVKPTLDNILQTSSIVKNYSKNIIENQVIVDKKHKAAEEASKKSEDAMLENLKALTSQKELAQRLYNELVTKYEALAERYKALEATFKASEANFNRQIDIDRKVFLATNNSLIELLNSKLSEKTLDSVKGTLNTVSKMFKSK